MSRREQRWPIWRIAIATAGCAAGSGVLFILAWLSARPLPDAAQAGSDARAATVNLPTVLMMLGMAVGLLAVLSLVWLGLRIREARTPPWKRAGHKRRP